MKKYLDKKTRIILKWNFSAMDNVLCLQRKKWYGWKTVSWNYPSVFKKRERSLKYIIEWLEWAEQYKKNKKKEKEIGQQIMTQEE
tara:strand:- start:2503 stop:2757 length:255 start_codon:yes stop_codon:yes gene_type:complete